MRFLALAAVPLLFLTGCAGYSYSFGASYTQPDGTSYGGNFKIDKDPKTVKPLRRESGFAK